MIFAWFKRRRRRKILAQPFPRQWKQVLARKLTCWPDLNDAERQKLKNDVQVFIAEKHWEGCAGLELTDEIKVTVAGSACLLLLGLEHDLYHNVQSILIYPSDYEATWERPIPGQIVSEEPQRRLGEAHFRGPVLLSWDAVRHDIRRQDGHNLVYHEFAHKLDMLDDLADGTPPLNAGEQYIDWVKVMAREYEKLCSRVDQGRATLLDSYAATNIAEFFAVATEVFFEQPRKMQRAHASLYDALRDFYQQDPAKREAAGRAAKR